MMKLAFIYIEAKYFYKIMFWMCPDTFTIQTDVFKFLWIKEKCEISFHLYLREIFLWNNVHGVPSCLFQRGKLSKCWEIEVGNLIHGKGICYLEFAFCRAYFWPDVARIIKLGEWCSSQINQKTIHKTDANNYTLITLLKIKLEIHCCFQIYEFGNHQHIKLCRWCFCLRFYSWIERYLYSHTA